MSSTFTISNGNITAVCSSAGAELISLKNSDGKEFLFRDKNIWDFSSPILFPICGGLKDDIYLYEGKNIRFLNTDLPEIQSSQSNQ